MSEYPSPSPSPPEFPRPYFIPESVDYDALPDSVRRALVNVVGPVYQDLVVNALNGMERSAGVTLVFLLTMEVLGQFALARVTSFDAIADADKAHERDKLIESHLRLISVKQLSARFVVQVEQLRQFPFTGTMRRLPI